MKLAFGYPKIGSFANLNPPKKPTGFSPHSLPSGIAAGVNAAVAMSPRTILGILAISAKLVGIAVIPAREIRTSFNPERRTAPSPATAVPTVSSGHSVGRRNQANRGGCERVPVFCEASWVSSVSDFMRQPSLLLLSPNFRYSNSEVTLTGWVNKARMRCPRSRPPYRRPSRTIADDP